MTNPAALATTGELFDYNLEDQGWYTTARDFLSGLGPFGLGVLLIIGAAGFLWLSPKGSTAIVCALMLVVGIFLIIAGT